MTLISGLLEDLTSMKDVWKSVSMKLGVLFVMVPGQPLMPMLHADNWDMVPQVSRIYFDDSIVYKHTYLQVQHHFSMPSLVRVPDRSTLMISSAATLRIVLLTVLMVDSI